MPLALLSKSDMCTFAPLARLPARSTDRSSAGVARWLRALRFAACAVASPLVGRRFAAKGNSRPMVKKDVDCSSVASRLGCRNCWCGGFAENWRLRMLRLVVARCRTASSGLPVPIGPFQSTKANALTLPRTVPSPSPATPLRERGGGHSSAFVLHVQLFVDVLLFCDCVALLRLSGECIDGVCRLLCRSPSTAQGERATCMRWFRSPGDCDVEDSNGLEVFATNVADPDRLNGLSIFGVC